MEEDFKEHCDKEGHRTLVLSIDVQGLKAVNDNIEHSKGTEVLTEYGEALEEAAKTTKQDFKKKGIDAFTCAYHIGGDEFALVVVAPEASLTNKIAEEITAAVAAIEPIVKVTTKRKQIPTMLRVGAGVGAGEGEEIMNVADGGETDVRRAIYMKGFGRMDARGAVIAKNDPKLEGTPNWRVQEFDAKIAAERAKVVEEGKKDSAEKDPGARGLATSEKLEALSFMHIGGLSDEAVQEAKDAANKQSEAKRSGDDKESKMEAEINDLKTKLAVFEAKKEQKKSQRPSSRLSSRPQSRLKPSLSDSRASSTSRARAQGPQVRSKRGPTPSKKRGGGGGGK